jgi:transposase
MLTAMFCLSESDTFYLYPYPTDMRKSFYSLSGIVTNEMKRDVQDGEAFIFVNRTLTSMKILHAEYGGLVIYNLKLEKGRIGLPDTELGDSSVTHRLTQWHELMLMAQGINPLGVKRSPRWKPQKQRKQKFG